MAGPLVIINSNVSFWSDALGPVHEILQKSDGTVLRRYVCQISFLIKAIHCVADQYLGLVDWEHIEIHENLPQMILRTRSPDASCGCTHDRGRFTIPGAVTVGTRSPINRIFQYTGHGPIVFRRNKQNSIRLTYLFFQLRDFSRRILLLVLVKRRNAIKLERFDSCAFRREFSCSAQRRAIV